MTAPGGYPPLAPHRLRRVAATQRWTDVAMVHWPVPPARVAALLPAGLEPDTYQGSAWASLVPFRMEQLTLPPVPALPVVGTFPETNVRTYVRGPRGPAVWFLSLDVPRAFMPPTARTLFGVPYAWSRMRIVERGRPGRGDHEIRYAARRWWPQPRGARSLVGVSAGDVVDPDPLDRFLVNRWGAYSLIRGRLHHTPVTHTAWPLREATLTVLSDELGQAVGLPVDAVSRVRFADGVTDVRFDWPSPVFATPGGIDDRK